MLTVGLTGGIGSGKSTVARLFEQLGVPIIDTDLIAHTLTAQGQPALAEIVSTFGASILQADGTLNRAALRQLVFSQPHAKNKLEAILHPLIRQQVKTQLAELSGDPYRIVVVPLLFETDGYTDEIQRSLLVDCPESLQLDRAMARSRLSAEDVNAILNAQMTRAGRLTRADDVIVNDSTLESLQKKVAQKHEKYISLA